jgi:protein gp37
MAQNSKIKWTDDTLNAVVGCSKRSEGCRNCYAVDEAWRMSKNPKLGIGVANPYHDLVKESGPHQQRNWTGKLRFLPDRLGDVGKWTGRLVFVNSLSDLGHEKFKREWLKAHFDCFRKYPDREFQILTKRPELFVEHIDGLELPEKIWLGVTVEHAKTMNRIQHIALMPVKMRWVSFEPFLSEEEPFRVQFPKLGKFLSSLRIDWIVVGGESSKDKDVARYLDLEDVRYILDQGRKAGIKVYLKQLGTRWAIKSNTYGYKGEKGHVNAARSGALVDLWPKDLRDPSLRQLPA